MLISYGRAATDATPQRIETSWPDLVSWLYQHPRTPAKLTLAEYAHLKTFPSKSPEGRRIHDDKTGPYIALADFGGHRRAYDTLIHSSGVPLDFDTGRVGAEVIAATLAGHTYAAFTTYAHQEEAQRWRVFVPVARPMSADEHAATWASLNERFQGQADPAAKDATRLSYLPGVCLLPEAALITHSDGTLLQPISVAPPAPATLQTHDGPVPGWAGPSDDSELITIACHTRVKVAERFGAPISMAMLWTANEEWLATTFPPSASEEGQSYSRTRADAALASELAYWTGGDEERAARLMRQSGLARDDDDWSSRKVYLAFAKGMEGRAPDQYHFMKSGKVSAQADSAAANAPNPTDTELKEACDETIALSVPAGTLTASQAVIANIPVGQSVSLNDFYAFMPDHTYIHKPSGERFSAASVDEAIGKEARQILVPTVPVHKYTWAPGKSDRFLLSELDDMYVDGERVWLYNSYRAPKLHTQAGDPTRWLELVRRLYPDDAEHLISYFADAVQHPGRKCNHAVVLGSGTHGIGKDTLIAPVAYAVGRNNFRSIKPTALASEFNPWVMSVMVQISESHDLGEGQRGLSRFEFYERCKDLAAAPPASIDCRPLYQNPFPVANVMRLLLTTNHQVDGLHIDAKDRRHYCAWSDAVAMSEIESKAIWEWYEAGGGLAHVANYLATLDLSARNWNHAAPPLRTPWWHQLVSGASSAEEDKFSDALEKLGRPEWVTLPMVEGTGDADLTNWIRHPANRRKLEREMVKSGYQRLPNPNETKRGRWPINGAQLVVYRRSDVPAATLLRKAV